MKATVVHTRFRARTSRSGLAGLAASAALAAVGAPAVAEEVLPRPAFDTSIQAGYYCINGCWESDATWATTVQRLKDRVGSGPYARLGLVYSVAPDMPWDADLENPALSSPTLETLRAQLDRAQVNGIHLSFSLTAGTSRSNGLYDTASREDRRNYQWYRDGQVLRGSFSRYARKLRRHLGAKMRAFAPMLMTVIQEYPDTFGVCAGDGEVELLSDRLNEATPYEDQIIADYSPFVILEFRDWLRNTGMYGPGGAYEGQGRAASGTRYSDPLTGLASFNADFDTSFASWDLEYFNWSLDDPIDGDPGAIPQAVFTAPGWSPLPTSGPAFIAGGFDAPRSWNEYSPEFWQLWLTFREMKKAGSGDKTYNLFAQLVAAMMNMYLGNDSSCVAADITAANDWLALHPVGSGVCSSSAAWSEISATFERLDQYNNGNLCAPHRDDVSCHTGCDH
jgi:hypothetical protein